MPKKICPYPGLRPFTEEESIFFKGRDVHIRQIIKQLEERKIVMITGASGDGKSSLVYAGVIPNARAGFFHAEYNNWRFVDFRPERDPLGNLSQSLAGQLNMDSKIVREKLSFGFSSLLSVYKSSEYYIDKNSDKWKTATTHQQKEIRNKAANLFILADQFEEFFTNTENFAEGKASVNAYTTVNLLLESARLSVIENLPVYVVFTMRSDFISQCVAFGGLPEVIGYSQFFVPRLKRNELQQVIEEPALLSGGKVSKSLTELLINELREGFDQLPVLQHALNLIWQMAGNGEQELDLLHLAKLAGMPSKYLNDSDKKKFDTFFNRLEDFQKKFYKQTELNNLLNAHANQLYETAYQYYKQTEWVDKTISHDESKHIIKIAFLSLTKVDQGRAVRNRMSINEITSIINQPTITYEVVCAVMNIFRSPDSTFIRPFIDVNDVDTQYLRADTVLDITHEALIRNWKLLQKWEQEEAANVADFNDFKIQLNRWTENNKSDEFLLPAGSLNYFEEWYERSNPNTYWFAKYDNTDIPKNEKIEQAQIISNNTKEFLSASRSHLVAIENAKRRRRNMALTGALIVILILSGFTYWAMREKSNAQKQQEIAELQKQEAEKQRLLAESEKNKVIAANKEAEAQRLLAEGNAKAANIARMQSDSARHRAELMRKLADEKTIVANTEAENARIARLKAEQQQKLAEEQKSIAELARDSAQTLTNLAIAQSLTFKALQNYDDTQLNFLLALEAYKINIENGGAENDAGIHKALSHALQLAGEKSTVYRSDQKLVDISVTQNGTLQAMQSDGNYLIFNISDMNLLSEKTFKYKYPVNSAFILDNKIAVSYENYDFIVWNKISGEAKNLIGHESFVRDVIEVSENKIISGSLDNTVRLWNTQTSNNEIAVYSSEGKILSMATSNYGIICGNSKGDVVLLDTEKLKPTLISKIAGRVTDMAISGKNKFLIVGSSKGLCKIFDYNNGFTPFTEIKLPGTMVSAVAIDDSNQWLAVALTDKSIKVFNINKIQAEPIVIDAHKSNIQKMCFFETGSIYALGIDNKIHKFETRNRQMAEQLKKHITRKLTKKEKEMFF